MCSLVPVFLLIATPAVQRRQTTGWDLLVVFQSRAVFQGRETKHGRLTEAHEVLWLCPAGVLFPFLRNTDSRYRSQHLEPLCEMQEYMCFEGKSSPKCLGIKGDFGGVFWICFFFPGLIKKYWKVKFWRKIKKKCTLCIFVSEQAGK